MLISWGSRISGPVSVEAEVRVNVNKANNSSSLCRQGGGQIFKVCVHNGMEWGQQGDVRYYPGFAALPLDLAQAGIWPIGAGNIGHVPTIDQSAAGRQGNLAGGLDWNCYSLQCRHAIHYSLMHQGNVTIGHVTSSWLSRSDSASNNCNVFNDQTITDK